MARISVGILNWDMFPLIGIGTCSVLLGMLVGGKIADRLNPARMKTIIYIFLIPSGIMTAVNSL